MDTHRGALRDEICAADLGKLPITYFGQDNCIRRPLLARDDPCPLSRWWQFLFHYCGKILHSQTDRAVMELAQTKNIESLVRAERRCVLSDSRRMHCRRSIYFNSLFWLRPSGPTQNEEIIMTWLFSPPSLDDLIRLLKAWRFWSLGALIGALIGAAIYYIAPPPYQARATVLVDFNLEEAWPQETDRQHFFYLEREARKLEEIAWSDVVIQAVADN